MQPLTLGNKPLRYLQNKLIRWSVTWLSSRRSPSPILIEGFTGFELDGTPNPEESPSLALLPEPGSLGLVAIEG